MVFRFLPDGSVNGVAPQKALLKCEMRTQKENRRLVFPALISRELQSSVDLTEARIERFRPLPLIPDRAPNLGPGLRTTDPSSLGVRCPPSRIRIA